MLTSGRKRSFLAAALFILAAGWGSVGHRIINKNYSLSVPQEMSFLTVWSDTLASHASDADNRKGSDPNESPKHFIDIDAYPEFRANRRISHNYDSVVAQHGLAFVIDNGTLPWSIRITTDSLTAQFRRGAWSKAVLTASDLGHYVGDGHMPLHITENYDGQLTGQNGVHSRYESTMIGRYTANLVYPGDSARYITDKQNWIFAFLYSNYRLVDSVLYADSLSKVMAVGQYNTVYYQKLWEMTGAFTIDQFRLASNRLASLIYTAWVDAGRPSYATGTSGEILAGLSGYSLGANWPNPFNPSTTFTFTLPVTTDVQIEVYTQQGEKVTELLTGTKEAGTYSITWKPNAAASGIYYYTLVTPAVKLVRKMIYLR